MAESLMLDALDLSARLVAVLSSASDRHEYRMANYKAGKAIHTRRWVTSSDKI